MVNVDALEQVADIFTKPFPEKTKWLHALRLINHNLCTDVAQKGGKDSDSHLVAKPTIAAASHGRPSLERIAQDLLMVKDFSYPGLLRVAAEFPTKVSSDESRGSLPLRTRTTTTGVSFRSVVCKGLPTSPSVSQCLPVHERVDQ